MSDGSSQTPDADTPETDTVASAASNGGAVRRLIGRPGAGAGLLAGIAGAAVALAFGELIDGLVDTIPSLVVAVGEALVDYSPDWAVKLSIELFGEKDKAVLAIGIVGVSLIIGGLLGACAMASRRRWVPIAGFAAFGVIGGWTAARNPMSPFVGSWIVAVIAAALGYVTLRMLLRLAPAHQSRTAATMSISSPPNLIPGDVPDNAPDASRRAFLLGVGGAGVAAVGLVALGRGVRGPSAAETARAGHQPESVQTAPHHSRRRCCNRGRTNRHDCGPTDQQPPRSAR